MVNALIHRDYLVLGSEVHIDMYDDRLEIHSPGGMFQGKAIQDCTIDEIDSKRRNPVIADLFHRMKFMERRGSGIRKILDETAKLPGYTEELIPTFKSTNTAFWVTIKNVNYVLQLESNQDDSKVAKKSGDETSSETSSETSLKQVLKQVLKQDDWDKVSGIVEYIDGNGHITHAQAKELCGKSRSTVWRYLKILQDTGYVVEEGSTNNILYKRSEKPL